MIQTFWYKLLLLVFRAIFRCLTFCHIFLPILCPFTQKTVFFFLSLSLFLSSFNIYIILIKFHNSFHKPWDQLPSFDYLPSDQLHTFNYITTDQLHTFNYIPTDQLHILSIPDSPVNYAFSFVAVPCLYYVIYFLSSRSPNARPVIRD